MRYGRRRRDDGVFLSRFPTAVDCVYCRLCAVYCYAAVHCLKRAAQANPDDADHFPLLMVLGNKVIPPLCARVLYYCVLCVLCALCAVCVISLDCTALFTVRLLCLCSVESNALWSFVCVCV
jgi:hypothetical protein